MARLRRTERPLLAHVGYWARARALLDALERGERDRAERAFAEELDELERCTVPMMLQREAAGRPRLAEKVAAFLAAVEDHDN